MVSENRLKELLYHFESLSLSPEIGLYPFKKKDICTFFEKNDQFELSLKRDKGCFVLYGKAHAQARRAFFNDLDRSKRIELCLKKMRALEIDKLLFDWLKCDQSDVIDVKDIGMGSSIYRIQFSNREAVVLKQETNHHFETFYGVLKDFDFPGIDFKYFKLKERLFLVMHDLGTLNLGDFILSRSSSFKKDVLNYVDQCAWQGCLGDVLGRGDRHMENYLIFQGRLFPIDVAYLFYQRNHFWTARYVASSSYEISICWDFGASEAILNVDRWRLFWQSYRQHHKTCIQKIGQLKSCQGIHRMFKQGLCLKEMYQAYVENVSEMHIRLAFKYVLEKLIQHVPEILEEDPFAKMYYYANLGRLNAFLHLKEHRQDFFDQLTFLAAKHKLVSRSFYKEVSRKSLLQKEQLLKAEKNIF